MLQFLSDINNLMEAARAMANALRNYGYPGQADWIFGSPMAGIPFATMVGTTLGIRKIGFTEKGRDDRELICRFNVEPGQSVLRVSEMTTTGGTPQREGEAILHKNPQAVLEPVVGAFLSRCPANPPLLKSGVILSVVNLPAIGVHFGEWDPKDCPMCAQGSQALENPKRIWKFLLATMKDPALSISTF